VVLVWVAWAVVVMLFGTQMLYELVANGCVYSELGPKGIRSHSMMG
jgi:hypothetical protein